MKLTYDELLALLEGQTIRLKNDVEIYLEESRDIDNLRDIIYRYNTEEYWQL